MIDLQRFRKIKKLSQAEISELTGLDQAVISKYENKKHVSDYIIALFLDKIPELESYMIHENVVKDDDSIYEINDTDKKNLISAINNLSYSNKLLAESIAEALDIQKKFIERLEIL
jgi:transcriptional regulator with XRE-family HTH domain